MIRCFPFVVALNLSWHFGNTWGAVKILRPRSHTQRFKFYWSGMEPRAKGGCWDSQLTLMCNAGESPSRTCGGPHRQVFQPLSLVLTVGRRQCNSKITSHRTHKSGANPSHHRSYLSLLGFSHNMLRTPLGHHFSSQMPPSSHQLVMISGQMQTIKLGSKESTFHYQSPKWLTPLSNCLLRSPDSHG